MAQAVPTRLRATHLDERGKHVYFASVDIPGHLCAGEPPPLSAPSLFWVPHQDPRPTPDITLTCARFSVDVIIFDSVPICCGVGLGGWVQLFATGSS
eukprot:3918782-Rhodomonas_salina.1